MHQKNKMIHDKLSKHPIEITQANGLQYAYIKKGKGPVIFLLHGFPDHAGSWDLVMDELSDTYCCIAPFLRGYYPTSIPVDRNYSVLSIAEDIHLLAMTLGCETYSVVGQDWGATIAYVMANLYDEQINKVVSLSMPHPRFLKPSLTLLLKARHILYFANKEKSPLRLAKNEYSYLDTLYKRWSPGLDYLALKQQMVACFEMAGRKEAALGYYWQLGVDGKQKERVALYHQFPPLPSLVLVGMQDGTVDLKQFKKMESASCFDIRYHASVGHFLHREDPSYCASQVRNFLEAA